MTGLNRGIRPPGENHGALRDQGRKCRDKVGCPRLVTAGIRIAGRETKAAFVPFLNANKVAGDRYQIDARITFDSDGKVVQCSREKRVDEVKLDSTGNTSSSTDSNTKSPKMPKALRKLF